MTDVEKKRSVIINVVYYSMLAAAAILFFRYGLGIFMPIIIAFIFASLLQRPKRFFIQKTPLKKGAAAALCVFLLLVLIGAIVALIGVRAAQEIRGFIDYMMIRLQDVDSFVTSVENICMNLITKLPNVFEEPLKESSFALFSEIREYLAGQTDKLPEQISGSLSNSFSFSWITKPLSGVVSTATKLPSFFIAFVITIAASCFMTADYEMISEFIDAQLSPRQSESYKKAKKHLKSSLSKMGKAYLLIICVTCTELLIGLSLLKIFGIYKAGYIVLISVAVAIVDIIPVLGTGTILIPWAVISLIGGNYPLAIGLLVLYAVISVIRQIIEPKLVAGQLGLPPFLTISAMYVGLKTMGVLGMFIAPMIIIMLKLLNDEGIIHLWKSPSKLKAEQEASVQKTTEKQQ